MKRTWRVTGIHPSGRPFTDDVSADILSVGDGCLIFSDGIMVRDNHIVRCYGRDRWMECRLLTPEQAQEQR